jgi:BASS family bile acid:Na+ symporter
MWKMANRHSRVASLAHQVHEHFIWLLIGSYALAALCPTVGLWLRGLSLGEVTLAGEKTRPSLPMLMLAFLLFNAGLGVCTAELRNLRRGLAALSAGLAANLAVPVAFIVAVALVLRGWPGPEQVQHLVVGLALIAAMPIAGSSAAWSQNASGNLPLSLGLVLASTFLSPMTTPVVLHSTSLLTSGRYAGMLGALASSNTGAFLSACVLLPSLLGTVSRAVVGGGRITKAKPALKLVNSINLLLLNYSNASLSLPQVVAEPDPAFLGLMLGVVTGLCAVNFLAGWAVARLVKADRAQQASLLFGLGMNNNGTGLVLASLALADHPHVLLPILCYNLLQHLAAGLVEMLLRGRPPLLFATPLQLVRARFTTPVSRPSRPFPSASRSALVIQEAAHRAG